MARYGDDTNRDRWRDDDRERSNWRSGSQGGSEREDERGFFERAGDEVRSWFSDEDDRGSGREQDRGRSGGWSGGSTWDRDQGRGGMSRSSGGGWSSSSNRGGGMSDRGREGGYGRMGRDMEDRSSFGGMSQGGRSGGSFGREHQRERDFGSSRSGGEWRSMSDQSPSGGSGGRGAIRGDRDMDRGGHAQSWGEANRGQSGSWNRDQDQQSLGYGSAMGGTLGGFGNQTTFGSSQDDHYRSWRDRQMSELDRDYDDYCREREQQFHSDFDSWRRNRPSRSPSPATNASGSDLGAAANAGVGTTTSSLTGTAGAGSAGAGGSTIIGGSSPGSSTGDATSQSATADTGTGSGGGRSGSRSRS